MRIPIGVTTPEGDGTRIYLRNLPPELVDRFNQLAQRQNISQSELFVAIMSTALADIEHKDIKKLLQLRLQSTQFRTIKILEELGFKPNRNSVLELARAIEYFASPSFEEQKQKEKR